MLANYPNQLRADLRRIYHLSIDDAGTAYSWRDLAAMVAYLPTDSAVRRAEGSGWSETERLVASILATLSGQEIASPNQRIQTLKQRQIPLEEKKRIVAEAYGYDKEVLDG